MAESVWDYPRPPRLEATGKRLQVHFNGKLIADTSRGYRVLETSHPPTYYFPPDDVDASVLKSNANRRSFCEWKGRASYFDLAVEGREAPAAAWRYPEPPKQYAAIRDFICFYPSKMEAVYVDGEQARAQEGDFYGGWITADIQGPFKGGAGTMGW